MYKFWLSVILAAFICKAGAQNALPDLSVDSLGKNRVRVSWVNPFGAALIQMNIQSSTDSIKNFGTFFSTPSPQLPQNGVVDTRVQRGKTFYRIFYVMTGGSYFFTRSRSVGSGPATMSDNPNPNIAVVVNNENSNLPSKYVMINPAGFAVVKLPDAEEKKYKIIFFDANHTQLFTINKIKDAELVLDKTNFMHAGLFYFELYENDKLIEKNKIFLQKDF